MSPIDTTEARAGKTRPSAGKSTFSIPGQTEIASPAGPPDWRTMGSVDAARFRRGQIGRSEWINLSFFAIMLLGGVFSAFYLFNGAELFRNALAWPRELLGTPDWRTTAYSGPLGLAGQGATAGEAAAIERPRGVPAPKTDPTGDPFPRVGGPLKFDRSPYTWAREAGGRPGATSLSPTPDVPGARGGRLPGPGSLISKLSLLVPGTDALTQSLRTAAADLEKNITVTIRHDLSRVVGGR